MGYRFQVNESLADGLPRIVVEQVGRALAELEGEEKDLSVAVHQVRKRCKKIRGVLRLVRDSFADSYQHENAWFRDLARGLSGARDRQAMLTCFDKLRDHFSEELATGAFTAVHHELAVRRADVHEDAELTQRVRKTATALQQARGRVAGWRLDEHGFAAVEQGLGRTYGRARKALRASYRSPAPEHFHEWRKRVKYHWYHLRLLRGLWPAPMKGLAAEAKQLADLLGDDHDLAVLREMLANDSDALGEREELDALSGLAERRQNQLRAAARTLGWRLFAEKPDVFRRRVGRYWQAAQADALRDAGFAAAKAGS
jgi:CHAD domain-containing protein